MIPDWARDGFEIVIGGPAVPLTVRFLRGGLVACSLFVGIQWLSMWGTRWGDRHLAAKSFILSILVHLCLCLGWATVITASRATSEASAAAPSPPIPVTFRESGPARSALETDASTPFWQRTIDAPASPQTRADRPQETDGAEVQRLDLSVPELKRDIEPSLPMSEVDVATTPQPLEKPEIRSPSIPADTLQSPDEASPEARPEARSTGRFQRTPSQKKELRETTDESESSRPQTDPKEFFKIKNALPTITPGIAGEPKAEPEQSDSTPRKSSPQPRRTRAPLVRTTPAPVSEPEFLASRTGVLRGVVKDAETGRAVAGTAVRFDQAQGKPLVAITDAEGRYELSLPETPDNFAVTASHGDYLPEAKNLKSLDVRGKTRRLDFTLRQPSESVVALEDEPEVHHLGNDRFAGTANSQFQRRSEGTEREFRFAVTADQLRRQFPDAVVTFMAKGVQCAPRVSINGHAVDSASKTSPLDGAYAALELPINVRWLRAGDNTLTIRASDCNGDLDDFEFVNIQIRLSKTIVKPTAE